MGVSGCIELIQPDPKWLDKVNAESQSNQSKISLNSLRARKAEAVGVTPLKGVTTPTGRQPNAAADSPPNLKVKMINFAQNPAREINMQTFALMSMRYFFG